MHLTLKCQNYQNETTMTMVNQYLKLKNIKIKRTCMAKQKTTETLQIREKSGRILPIGRKGSCMIKIS